MANIDSRGVSRGRCVFHGCSCSRYSREPSGKCASCTHPPAKHLNLNSAQADIGQSVGFPASQQHFQQPYVPPSPAANVGPPPIMQPAWQSPAYSAPILDDCSACGCTRKVHYDQELGPFDYCSPECRDRHLLPEEKKKLKRDIEGNREEMITYLPAPSSPSSSPSSSAAAAKTSTDGKNKIMETIVKEPKEKLGILTANIPGDNGLRIVGVEMKTPAYQALKEGQIKLLDVITHLNEDEIYSRESLDRNTRDKTRPMLTIRRNQNTASGTRNLLSKIKEKFPTATHLKVAIHPTQIQRTHFGFRPLQKMGRYFLQLFDSDYNSAHLSGITAEDEVLFYTTMNSKKIMEGVVPSSLPKFKEDVLKARQDGRHIVLVVKN